MFLCKYIVFLFSNLVFNQYILPVHNDNINALHSELSSVGQGSSEMGWGITQHQISPDSRLIFVCLHWNER